MKTSETTVASTPAAVVEPSNPSIPFGRASFSWPEKSYSTKDGKTSTYARVTIPINGSVLSIETVIWKTAKIEDGNPVEEFTVGMPRGIVLADKDESLKDVFDAYKLSVLEDFDKWTATVTATGKRREAPRLVRKATASK